MIRSSFRNAVQQELDQTEKEQNIYLDCNKYYKSIMIEHRLCSVNYKAGLQRKQ